MATILVVDDDDDLRPLLVGVLQAAGYQTLEASNGVLGLRLLRQQKVDLLVTDLVMPEKEGLELIMDVRAQFPGLRVVAISGGVWSSKQSFLPVAKKLGADRAMSKPFTIEQFLTTIEEVLASDRAAH